MARFKHTHQLIQLRRLDPEAAQKAQLLLDADAPASAASLIIRAMRTALARLAKPQTVELDQVLDIFQQAIIESAPAPGQERFLCQTPTGKVTIHRLPNQDRLRLILRGQGMPVISKSLARFGFDAGNISGRAGCWKLETGVQGRFDDWLRKAVSDE